MLNAGYADNSYTIVIQTYSSPLPNASGMRYRQSGYTRQATGGCGQWNRDLDWANNTVVPAMNATLVNGAAATGLSNYVILDNANLLAGRRLCENTVGLARRAWRRQLAVARCGRQQRVGQSGAHGHHHLRPVSVARGSASELLGADGAA
jgi:hypothetical protein